MAYLEGLCSFFINHMAVICVSGFSLTRLSILKGTSLHLYFLITNLFSVLKIVLWYLNMSFVDKATRFKIGKYLLNRETV